MSILHPSIHQLEGKHEDHIHTCMHMIHTHIHTYIYTCISYMYIYIYIYKHTLQTYVHAFMCTYIHMYMHIIYHICIHIYTNIHYRNTDIHTYIHNIHATSKFQGTSFYLSISTLPISYRLSLSDGVRLISARRSSIFSAFIPPPFCPIFLCSRRLPDRR